jgi:threonine dehydrogenase-like Zn-dependent dehydrogenase
MTATEAGISHFALLTEPELFVLDKRPLVQRGAERIVRVTECGICGSDLKMYSGQHPIFKPPLILGHEFYGVVEGDGGTIPAGTAVVCYPPVGCGACYHCTRGLEYLCAQMQFFGGERQGGLSDRVSVPEANLMPIPEDVPDDQRVLIEPLAVAVHAADRAAVVDGEACLVIGAGPIGLLTTLVLQKKGVASIAVADLSAERLERARAFGLETVNVSETTLEDYVRDEVRPEGVDVVLECVGSVPTIQQALRLTCKGGRVVHVGNGSPELALDGVLLQRGERSIVGVLMYTRQAFQDAMALLADGLLAGLPADDLVQRFSIEQVADAFAALKHGEIPALKASIQVGDHGD